MASENGPGRAETVASVPAKRKSPVPRLLILVAAFITVAAVGLATVKALTPQPFPIAATEGFAAEFREASGGWFWVEGARDVHSRLVRLALGRRAILSQADRIGSFALSESLVAWTELSGGQWSIQAAASDGARKRLLTQRASKPIGLCVAEGRVLWLEQSPPTFRGAEAFAPLAGAVRILSVSVDGGEPRAHAVLMEPKAGKVAGVFRGQAFVTTRREGGVGATALYRIRLDNGDAEMIAGEAGFQDALLSQDGRLYWTGMSREDSELNRSVCVRRSGSEANTDQASVVADWLPSGGTLVETVRGIVYVDGDPLPRAWPLDTGELLARPFSVPRGFTLAGAGRRHLLLRPSDATDSGFRLFGLPL